MGTVMRKIEVDEETAVALEKRAAESGIGVAELVAEMTRLSETSDELAELERRWAEFENSGESVPHDDVVRWLKTWGTPAYKPWFKD
jgi:predicted transcriptional regulator